MHRRRKVRLSNALRPGIIDRRDETKIMALSIYCASMYGGSTPLPTEECVRRARDLSSAVDKSFESELQAEQERRIVEIHDEDEKAKKLRKARRDIYGDEDREDEE